MLFLGKTESPHRANRWGFFCFAPGKSNNQVVNTESLLDKAKKTLKLLTKRNRGRNVRRVMQAVKVFIRGWIGYFRVADMKRTLTF